MFGPFLVAISGFLILLFLQVKREIPGRRLLGRWLAWLATFLLLPLGFMVLIVLLLLLTSPGRELLEGIRNIPAVYAIVGDEPWLPLVGQLLLVKLRTWVMPLVVAGLAALGVVLLQHSVSTGSRGDDRGEGGGLGHPSLQFALICLAVGLLLTLSVEFFYLVDNFRVRMNTIFKFYFQAWIVIAIASAFAVYWLSRHREGQPRAERVLRGAFLAGFWLLFVLGMFYPVLGNISRAGNFAHPPTLDGTAYLAESQPDDYQATAWLNQQVTGAPVILEAPGRGGSSYVYEGRVAALTGLPTLLGWAGHEGQWRGSYEIQAAREPDIDLIYNTLDPQTALDLLDKYEVAYVYVGPLERSQYDPRGLDKFERLLDVAYRNDGVTIYRIPR
jgi:YYY domain-containing protein